MIRIVIVDDSALLRSILKNLFQREPDIQVVGEAANGEAALRMAKAIAPDLILMDIDMPVMDGLAATRRLMEEAPTPVLVLANGLTPEEARRARGAGAADAIPKPSIDQFNETLFLQGFLERIRRLARKERPFQRAAGAQVTGPLATPSTRAHAGFRHFQKGGDALERTGIFRIVVMGASTGGPAALKALFEGLPADFPLGIVLVQHMESGFMEGFVRWLDEVTPLSVEIARHREEIRPGRVYISPTDIHLSIRGNRLALADGPRVLNQKPSVDLLFESAAAEYGPGVMGVLLTGMGRDGARGCLAIVDRGGVTIVQDRSTSAIYGMPKAAVDLDAATVVLPLEHIPAELIRRAKVTA